MPDLERDDIQGLIARGYPDLKAASYVLLQIADAGKARAWLGRLVDQVTPAPARPPDTALNVAVTASGLERLGLPAEVLGQFSNEFTAGMTTPHRRRMLGDEDENTPERWLWGGPNTPMVDLLLLMFARDDAVLSQSYAAVSSTFSDGGVAEVSKLDAVIDLDGNMVAGTHHPPGERFIHTEIYRARPDVGGIVHTHQTLATMFGVMQREILPLLHVEAPLVARGIPTYPSPELIHDPERGAAVAAALGDYPVCHLQGHGVVTVAPTVQEATIAAIHLERLARANYIAAQLGGNPRVIPQAEIDRLHGPMVDYRVRWAYYTSLVEDASLPANW